MEECNGKKKYKGRVSARKAANRAENARGGRLRVYQCPTCGYWHLTSNTEGALRMRTPHNRNKLEKL